MVSNSVMFIICIAMFAPELFNVLKRTKCQGRLVTQNIEDFKRSP